MRRRQDYVEGLYSRAHSTAGRFLNHKAADWVEADFEQRIRDFQSWSGRPRTGGHSRGWGCGRRAGRWIDANTPGRAAKFSQRRSLAACTKALSMRGWQ